MNTNLYLKRIGMRPEDVSHTYEFLKALQQNHICTVPYENLDILNEIPIDLSKEALFEKIVTNHRGGYCFELNGAIAHLVQALGFATKCYFARFLKGEAEIPVRRHRVVVTECEVEFIALRNNVYCPNGMAEEHIVPFYFCFGGSNVPTL